MDDELIDIINDNNEVVGQAPKSEAHKKGLPHRISAVFLQNSNGEYLIPTVSDKKAEAGGLCHSAAGHVPSQESSAQAATRELWEEVGLRASPEQFEYLGSFWLTKNYPTRKEKERFDVFRIKYSEDIGEIKLNEEQINEQWLSEEQLKDLYLSSPDKLAYSLKLSCENIFNFQTNSG